MPGLLLAFIIKKKITEDVGMVKGLRIFSTLEEDLGSIVSIYILLTLSVVLFLST